jgi:hypothetical protein
MTRARSDSDVSKWIAIGSWQMSGRESTVGKKLGQAHFFVEGQIVLSRTRDDSDAVIIAERVRRPNWRATAELNGSLSSEGQLNAGDARSNDNVRQHARTASPA